MVWSLMDCSRLPVRYGRSRSRDAFRATAGKNQSFMMEGAAACFMLEERENVRDDEEGAGRGFPVRVFILRVCVNPLCHPMGSGFHW